MKEKTKKIISYVACALGGACLGIALLGGLSMCATKKTEEEPKVNTILTKRNERITTTEGEYTGYGFSIDTQYPTTESNYSYTIYSLNPLGYNAYTPNRFAVGAGSLTANNRNYLVSTIESAYSEGKVYQNENRQLRFLLAFFAYANPYTSGDSNAKIAYITFIEPSFTSYQEGNSNANTAFIMTTNGGWTYKMSLAYGDWNAVGAEPFFTITNSKTSFFNFTYTIENSTLHFQDVESYYKELGYQDGDDDGYSRGYADGYDDGSNNGLLFTDLGVNQLTWSRSDIVWDAQTDTTATMKLFDFKDGENQSYYVSFTDYSIGGGTPSVEVYKNGTASNNLYATIASGTWNNSLTLLEVIPSKYLKFDFAQITTYYHDSIPNGWFMLSGIPANATGYEVGYQTGYKDGFNSSPGGQATNNVFSLFTNAFDAVGGIFNMKIFGFLPLYWFFLTPIFIAIITLLLRLIKH